MPSSPDAGSPDAAAVVVAAGAGRRFGGPVRKQYLEVGGEPVLLRALRSFLRHPRVGAVVVVLPPDDAARPPAWLAALPVEVTAGGAERGDSVRAGLARVPEHFPLVLIHDGARPFVDGALIDRVLEGCAGAVAAIPALPVTDTLQEVDGEGWIVATPDRERFRRAQTPQAFPRKGLLRAYAAAAREGTAATDDAAIYARFEGPVRTVEGSAANLKVTRPVDLVLAEGLAALPGPREGAA